MSTNRTNPDRWVPHGGGRIGILALAVYITAIGCSDAEPDTSGVSPVSGTEALPEMPADARPSVTLAAALPSEGEPLPAQEISGVNSTTSVGDPGQPPAASQPVRESASAPQNDSGKAKSQRDTADTGRASGPQSIYAGVYTVAQAERGSAIVQKECSSCHNPRDWGEGDLLRGFTGRSAYDLVAHIRNTMPMDGPGRLTHQEYTDIVAYLFQLNAVPTGTAELSADQASQGGLRIEYQE